MKLGLLPRAWPALLALLCVGAVMALSILARNADGSR